MMFWYDHSMGWWGYLGMGVGMVLIWSLIIAGIVALIRFSTANNLPGQLGSAGRVPPEQLLAERYARGDIDDADYHHRLAALRDHGAQ